MSVNAFHDHGWMETPVRRISAGWKFFIALAIVLTTVLLPRTEFIGLAAVGLIVVMLAVASRIPATYLLKRLLLLEPLVIGVALLMLFQPNGGRLLLGILLKTNICLLTTILLSSTTPSTEMLRLLKQLRVPWLMVSTLTLMHRYLFVLAEESERMRRARASRTLNQWKHFQWRALATVLGQLFIRATERAERIYNAMCARGWK